MYTLSELKFAYDTFGSPNKKEIQNRNNFFKNSREKR